MRGSCLCGGVVFEVTEVLGPFELCHCSRCRKASGSAFVAGLGVSTHGYRLVSGRELIRVFEAPILVSPPAYTRHFCTRCGCMVPPAEPEGDWLEIPAGLLDDDPGTHPDKHICVDHAAAWYREVDALPRYTLQEVVAHRRAASSPC